MKFENLEGKKLSILGDSISTYEGVSNDTSANVTIGANPSFYREPFLQENTYWGRLLSKYKMVLCVNNSWSGGLLSTEDDSGGLERAKHLANNRCEKPDIIIVFMGINDFGYMVDIEVFAKAYLKTLLTLKSEYSEAKVLCVSLPDRSPFFKDGAIEFNNAIIDAIAAVGENFRYVDLFSSALNNYTYVVNSFDTLHPAEKGMAMIAETIEKELKEL